jgi:hypothetical protein
LVFSYDMTNTQKSWKGAPTTNLYSSNYGDTGTTDGFGGGSYLDTAVKSATPLDSTTVFARKSNVGIATWSVSANLTAGVTYTYSIWCKTIAWTTVAMRRNEPGVYVQESKTVSVTPGQWTRVSFTFTVSTGKSGTQVVGIGVGDANAGGSNEGIFLFAAQLEQQSFMTSYTPSTRSNTQAIVDLTGKNTITANNLTYSSDGTFSFNGSSSWLEMPTSSIFDTQALTMECWCKPTTTSQSGFLFEKGQVNTQYSNFFNSDGTFYFRTKGLSTEDLTFASGSYITANRWNHIVCTYGSGTKIVYVNGVAIAQQTGLTGNIPTGQTNQYVGKYGSASNQYPFSGSIAVSKVYNRALSISEVQQNFNALRGRYGI